MTACAGPAGRSDGCRTFSNLRAVCALSFVCVVAAATLATGDRPSVLTQKGKEDLSMFRDSSVSFYDPGDTAADSDILPREVLEDDGSRSDRADAAKPERKPNYGDAHWYKTGEGSDPHGDLQEKNRARHDKEVQKIHHQDEVDQERQRQAVRQQARTRRRRAAAVQQLRERRRSESQSAAPKPGWGRTSAPSYKEMQQQLAKEDSSRRAQILKHSGLNSHGRRPATYQTRGATKAPGGKVGFAYKHPFEADKLGMQNLVMAEFSQDEHKMKATTNAIFGAKSDKSKWSHGGLLLSDVNQAPPRTLHQAMQERRAHMRAQAKHQELSAEAQMRRHEAKHAEHPLPRPRYHKVQLRCSIEMLEHGQCSSKPHVGTHGDIPKTAAQPSARRTRLPARGRDTVDTSSGSSKSAAAPQDHLAKATHPQFVVSVPTAGTVMSGWASDVGSWF